MARKSPAFSFYPDSWYVGTLRLSIAQRGAYMDLLCTQWMHGPFSFDEAKIITRWDNEKELVGLLSEKFIFVNGRYFNERLEEERAKQQARAEAGRKGGKGALRGNGFAYAIARATDGAIKLGCSVSPERRLAQLKSRAGVEMELLAAWSAPDMVKAESILQGFFAEFRDSGEWFHIKREALDNDDLNDSLRNIGCNRRAIGAQSTDDSSCKSLPSVSVSVSVSDSDSVSNSVSSVIPPNGGSSAVCETAKPPAVLMTFKCNGKPDHWDLDAKRVAAWKESYPDLDVMAECRKAAAWLGVNTRKTAKGMPRFLVKWLNRACDNRNVRKPASETNGFSSPSQYRVRT